MPKTRHNHNTNCTLKSSMGKIDEISGGFSFSPFFYSVLTSERRRRRLSTVLPISNIPKAFTCTTPMGHSRPFLFACTSVVVPLNNVHVRLP